ncbi:hypothetical protein ACQKMI_24495, partial [Lysinibacillus sp. NPDC097214]|uniref:hypothetical protein n=1 Tax=Lysinibacillus sp. NPDC097214 TaxID=3390584 RepID=UPI003D01B832
LRDQHRAAAATLHSRFRAKDICWPETLERSGSGTKAKIITSCDNAFVTNILLPRRPQESAQPERKSTTHFA